MNDGLRHLALFAVGAGVTAALLRGLRRSSCPPAVAAASVAVPAQTAPGDASRPLCVELLVHNVSKPRNLDNAVRCAAVLGVRRVLLVGRRKHEKAAAAAAADGVAAPESGAEPAAAMAPLGEAERASVTPSAAAAASSVVTTVKYYADAMAVYGRARDGAPTEPAATQRVIFVGLEIDPSAVDATVAAAEVRRRFPCCDTVVFLPGNEGTGLTPAEKVACDLFVTVRQRCRCVAASDADASGGAGSLNVNTALAVALQQFLAHA